MSTGKMFGALSAILLAGAAAAPAYAQQDNCQNEVDEGSNREQCTVVGGGGQPAGGGGTDPRTDPGPLSGMRSTGPTVDLDDLIAEVDAQPS